MNEDDILDKFKIALQLVEQLKRENLGLKDTCDNVNYTLMQLQSNLNTIEEENASLAGELHDASNSQVKLFQI